MGCPRSATNYAVLLVSISYGAAVDELPIQRDQRLLQKAVREKELELAAAKEELEDVRAQFEKAKAEGLAQVHEEAKSISSKLP